jgi:hypothetical protein
MRFLPLDRMFERVEIARGDNDFALFMNLMYFGEMLVKCIVAGLVAGIVDDRQRSRYGIVYQLVRADGLGEWASALDAVLTGPTAQFMTNAAIDLQRDLNQRYSSGDWHYEAVASIQNCIEVYDDTTVDNIRAKVNLRRWFALFTQLRNKSRAHGAPQSGKCSKICVDLEKSLLLIYNNFELFNRSWVFLHRNLSGKYRVTGISADSSPFDYLKRSTSTEIPNLPDGIYIQYDSHCPVELIFSDPDVLDFYFPNGNFNNKIYELISYVNEAKKDGDSTIYLTPASELPESETKGNYNLDIVGNVFSNLPPCFKDYVRRPILENELEQIILDDRHPIVTLVGRGGIGKTWLALDVLDKVTRTERFQAIIWFSARDIDLLPSGPKQVKPNVLDQKDVAGEFARLMNPSEMTAKGFKAIDYFEENLIEGAIGPILFVFDNFETVRNPVELFTWIDTYIRLPNKVLITTRFREFKADYHIEVTGMNDVEATELIQKTVVELEIFGYITQDYENSLIQESAGHPYVIKILLGEVAKAKKLVKVERIVADSDDILKALFERTYNSLSPVAKRVFLTLCNWRSLIPKIALEAVLLRPENDRMDVLNAIDELIRSSFVEIIESEKDEEIFLTVPLVTMIFGRKKLAVSPMKTAVELDTSLLREFGSMLPSDVHSGVAPRIERLFKSISEKVNRKGEQLESYLPILELVCRKYPPSWLYLASLYEESTEIEDRLEKSKQAVQSYLESPGDLSSQRRAWKMYQTLCVRTSDWLGEVHAIVEQSQLPGTSFQELSDNANRLNSLFTSELIAIDTFEKEALVSKLLDVIEKRAEEGDATDYSRIAWLALNIHDETKAKEYTERGLAIEPTNPHIQSLANRLRIY